MPVDTLTLRIEVQDDGTATLRGIGRSIQGITDAAASAGRTTRGTFSQIRQDFNDIFKISAGNLLADGIKNATSAMKDFTKESVSVFLRYDTALNNVRKLTGMSSDDTALLGKKLQGVAIDLKALGREGSTELLKIAAVAGQLGIASDKINAKNFTAAREELAKFTQTIAVGSIALVGFAGGSEEIATLLAKQLTLYGANASQAQTYLGVINKLDDTMAAAAPQIASFLASFTMGKQYGISQAEAAALGATLISVGQDAYDASTRFSSALANIAAATGKTIPAINRLFANNEQAVAQLEAFVGRSATSTDDYINLMKEAVAKNGVQATQILIGALNNVEQQSDRNTLSLEIFGRIGSRVIGTLLGGYADITEAGMPLAASILSTETAIAGLEEATGLLQSDFADVGEFIAAAFAGKPDEAISFLITQIRNISDPVQQMETAIAVFGEKAGKTIAEGGKNTMDQLRQAIITAQRETAAGGASIMIEYETSLKKAATTFAELETQLGALQFLLGEQLAPALGKIVGTSLTPLIEQFRTWMTTSEEAKVFFAETLPTGVNGAIAIIGTLASSFVSVTNEIKNLASTWGEWIGDLETDQTTLWETLKDAGKLMVDENRTQTGEQTSTTGGTLDNQKFTAPALDTIQKLKTEIVSLGIVLDKDLAAKIANVSSGLQTMFDINQEPAARLKQQFTEVVTEVNALRTASVQTGTDMAASVEKTTATVTKLSNEMVDLKEKTRAVGVEAVYSSVFPDMQDSITETSITTMMLSDTMTTLRDEVAQTGVTATTSFSKQTGAINSATNALSEYQSALNAAAPSSGGKTPTARGDGNSLRSTSSRAAQTTASVPEIAPKLGNTMQQAMDIQMTKQDTWQKLFDLQISGKPIKTIYKQEEAPTTPAMTLAQEPDYDAINRSVNRKQAYIPEITIDEVIARRQALAEETTETNKNTESTKKNTSEKDIAKQAAADAKKWQQDYARATSESGQATFAAAQREKELSILRMAGASEANTTTLAVQNHTKGVKDATGWQAEYTKSLDASTQALFRQKQAAQELEIAKMAGASLANTTTLGVQNAPSSRKYHTGGFASDEVPAILQTGEYVLSRADVRQLHANPSSVIQKVTAARYHDGGTVAASNPTSAPMTINLYGTVIDEQAIQLLTRKMTPYLQRQQAAIIRT
jgi:TP901 family phage tail tape measure protein